MLYIKKNHKTECNMENTSRNLLKAISYVTALDELMVDVYCTA
jgi:hypothetical protein